MKVKIFDPVSEEAVNKWLAAEPRKEVASVQLFDTRSGGRERQIALVFYEEERLVVRKVIAMAEPGSGAGGRRQISIG